MEILIDLLIGLFTVRTQNVGCFHFRSVTVCTLGRVLCSLLSKASG